MNEEQGIFGFATLHNQRSAPRSRLAKYFLALSAVLALPAHADWVQGAITDIQIVAAGDANDKIVVWGTFTTGCTYNGFILTATDPYFKETYATMLAAKMAGTPIKYLHIYCHTSGLSRGNGYMSVTN